jgi:hypothetical protein
MARGDEREIDPVIRAYMAGVDRTLIRENLKKTPDERVRALQALVIAAEEMQRAGKKLRRG